MALWNVALIQKQEKKVVVRVDGQLFTEYHFAGFQKPLFYPLKINDNVGMTRNFPIKKVKGEQPDHPHHKSVWFSHEINNIMFWTEKGKVVQTEFTSFDKASGFATKNSWIHKDKTILTDETQISFHAGKGWRAIDFKIKLIASEGDVLMNDTKEGTFAVRVHPNLRNKPHKPSGIKGGATMVNSNGDRGPGIWGKPAKWVDYSGKIDDQVYGVSIFDHPNNLRHPAMWHARDYGLLAANPFGEHYFLKKKKGAGEYTIKKGQSLTLRYRLVIHEGNHEQANISELYNSFADSSDDAKKD